MSVSAPTISRNFSGIVIDQNHSPRTALAINDTTTYYQTFRLPENFSRGSLEQIHFPALSGFQVLIGVAPTEPNAVELDYALEQYFFGSGWSPITAGTAIGCQASSERVWMDVLFDHAIPVDESMVPSELRDEAPTEFRLAISFRSQVEKLWHVTPNPYSHGEAYHEGTPLKGSLNFRLLGLVGDSGTDFLGNPYRSVAVISESSNAGANPNTGYWLSAPQPSAFAVVSHYSDVRPLPTTPQYGTINRVMNPNFEWDLVGKLPALWESFGNAILRINRWRSEWNELTTYAEGEGVSLLDGKTLKTFVSLSNGNRAHNPLTDEAHWKESTGQFEPVKGLQYLEVKTSGANQGVRLGSLPSTQIVSVPSEKIKAGEYRQRLKAFLFLNTSLKNPAIKTPGGHTEGEVPVKLGTPITFSFWIRCEGASFEVDVAFGNSTVGEATSTITVTSIWKRHELVLTPTESGFATASITTKGAHTFFLDVTMVNTGSVAASYIDGDVISCIWNGPKGHASSVQLVEEESEDNAVVIDSMLVDPITLGVGMNVYYSSDLRGSEGEEPTIEQWEQKLWTRVPETYTLSGKTTVVFPEPIRAKFVKVECTNLQAKPYDPGDYQNPIRYKKFPDWVAEVFLAQHPVPDFVVSNVGVVFDKIELMYIHYLKDLHRKPKFPNIKSRNQGEVQDLIDPTTFEKIHQVIKSFTQPPVALAQETLLAQQQRSRGLKENNYQIEGVPAFNGPNTFAVSSLNRADVVLEQSMPIMFFYLTCRHEYKEATGKFAEKKAYFAGLKQLAFLRHSYTTTYDGDIYIESGLDDVNTDRNDFDVEEGIWFVN